MSDKLAYSDAHDEKLLFCFEVNKRSGTAVIAKVCETKPCVIIFDYHAS